MERGVIFTLAGGMKEGKKIACFAPGNIKSSHPLEGKEYINLTPSPRKKKGGGTVLGSFPNGKNLRSSSPTKIALHPKRNTMYP